VQYLRVLDCRMRSMQHIRIWTCWGLVMLAIVLSPIVVILAVPLAIGIGLDVVDAGGEMPLVLALCAPLAIAPLRHLSPSRLLRRTVLRRCSRQHLDHAANLIHAP
jgi:hypothetical protein